MRLSVQQFEKINATGVASVLPGKGMEWIGVAKLRQMKFRQMKFRQIKTSFYKQTKRVSAKKLKTSVKNVSSKIVKKASFVKNEKKLRQTFLAIKKQIPY